MKQIYVKFADAGQVGSFVNAISSVEEDFELGSGMRVVDPKSILGVFSLDLSQPQRLQCNSDNMKWLDKIRPFLYQKKTGGLR